MFPNLVQQLEDWSGRHLPLIWIHWTLENLSLVQDGGFVVGEVQHQGLDDSVVVDPGDGELDWSIVTSRFRIEL